MKDHRTSRPLLLTVLRDSEKLESLTPGQWETLLRQARQCRVLSRIALDAEARGLSERLPERVMDHLAAARHLARSHERNIHWEVNRIRRALRGLDVPIVLLKGAAYTVRELPPARGRLATDIDIMVPRRTLMEVQNALQATTSSTIGAGCTSCRLCATAKGAPWWMSTTRFFHAPPALSPIPRHYGDQRAC
jgi:hypothetical protein